MNIFSKILIRLSALGFLLIAMIVLSGCDSGGNTDTDGNADIETDLSTYTLTYSPSPLLFTGNEVTSSPVWKSGNSDTTLIAGTEVSYSLTGRPTSATSANVTISTDGKITVVSTATANDMGDYTITATGMGTYTGTLFVTININIDFPATGNYYKIGSTGSILTTQDGTWSATGTEAEGTKWSCALASDGLYWEVKTDDVGDRHATNTYRWGGLTAEGRDDNLQVGTYYDDWNTLVNAANSETLCGFTDWRIPTKGELDTIIDKSKILSTPKANTDIFPNTRSSFYWTSSLLPLDAQDDSSALSTDFTNFNSSFYNARDEKLYVRLVR